MADRSMPLAGRPCPPPPPPPPAPLTKLTIFDRGLLDAKSCKLLSNSSVKFWVDEALAEVVVAVVVVVVGVGRGLPGPVAGELYVPVIPVVGSSCRREE